MVSMKFDSGIFEATVTIANRQSLARKNKKYFFLILGLQRLF